MCIRCHAHVPLCTQKQPFKRERCDLNMHGHGWPHQRPHRGLVWHRTRTSVMGQNGQTMSSHGYFASYVMPGRRSKPYFNGSRPY